MNIPDFVDIPEAEAYGRQMNQETFWLVFQRRFHRAAQADLEENILRRSELFQQAMRDLACCHAYGDEQLRLSLKPSHE